MAVGAVLALGVAGVPAAVAQSYDVITLPFSIDSSIALNDNGVVVGEIANPDGSVSLGEWSQGALTNLGLPSDFTGGVSFIAPAAINDSGTIVGTIGNSGAQFPFIYSAGVFTLLPLANPHDGGGAATALNNLGQIVGTESGPNGLQSWLWSQGKYSFLPVAADNVIAVGINSRGTIVGNQHPNCCSGAAGFLLNGGKVEYLSGGVNAISAAGVAAGSNGTATLIRDGIETAIPGIPGSDSTAAGINSLGDVAGYYLDPATGLPRAFMWNPNSGGFDVTPNEFFFATAQAINDLGDIIGSGSIHNGPSEDFLLTPDANGEFIPKAVGTGSIAVPEPDTWLLFGLGLVAILGLHRQMLTHRH